MTITVANISLEMLKNLSNIGDGGEGIKKLGGRAGPELEELKDQKTFSQFLIVSFDKFANLKEKKLQYSFPNSEGGVVFS